MHRSAIELRASESSKDCKYLLAKFLRRSPSQSVELPLQKKYGKLQHAAGLASFSIDGDMSNKTTREGDIATRAAASMGGFVIAITDPASHSFR